VVKGSACVFALFAVLASCGGEERAASVPRLDVPSKELVIVDSIGAEMGDSVYMFGSIEGLGYAPDGSIVLLDRTFSRVMQYTAQGDFIRQIGREGDGPGEMSMAVGMVLTGDGDLLVSQRDVIEHFDLSSGEWITEYPRGETPPPFVLEGMPDSTFVGVHLDLVQDDARMLGEVVLGIYQPGNNTPLVVLDESINELNLLNAAFLFEDVMDAYSVAVGDDGTVYVASNSGSEYSVHGFDRTGEMSFRLQREDIDPVEMTEEELALEKEFMQERLRSMGAGDQRCVPDPMLPMISDLGIGPEGSLWVRRGNLDVPHFDVYDEAGELIETVTLPVDPEGGRYWRIHVQPTGILAFDRNPAEGYQKVYVLESR
jgi:hypothetical protein